MLMSEMSYPEVREYFKNNKTVIVPCGSTEQHGHHLPVGTDCHVANYFSKRLGENLNLLVAPSINFGYAEYHKDHYPGTIAFDQDFLYDLYYYIAKQLIAIGATHIVFVNGHGGNSYVLNRVSMNLRREFNVLAVHLDWWSIAGQMKPEWEEKGHAGKPETAAIMYMYPQYVNMVKSKFQDFKTIIDGVETLGSATFRYKGVNTSIWLNTYDVVGEVGNYGEDPKLATLEMGQESVEAVVAWMTDFVGNKFMKMELEDKINK